MARHAGRRIRGSDRGGGRDLGASALCIDVFAGPRARPDRSTFCELGDAFARPEPVLKIDHIAAKGPQSRPSHEWGSLVLRPAVSMVSIGPQYHHDHPTGDPCALASRRFSPKSLSPASRNTWSSDLGLPPKDGAPSCVTTPLTSLPWTYSLLRPLASTCSIAFIIVRLTRRDLVWINVTPHPTANWIARIATCRIRCGFRSALLPRRQPCE